MDERTLQFRVGVVVLAAVIIAVLLTALFSDWFGGFGGQRTIFVRFDKAPGVTKGTPVRKSGVLIGRVRFVKLLPKGGVLVTTKIENKFKVYSNETCRIVTDTLLGDAALRFVPSGDTSKPYTLVPDESYIKGIVIDDPIEMLVQLQRQLADLNLGDLAVSITGASNEVNELAGNLNAMVGNNREQFQRITQKSEMSLDEFRAAMVSVNDIIGDERTRERLKKALNDLPDVIENARDTLVKIEQASDSALANLDNLKKFSGPLGERGPAMVANMDGSVEQLRSLLGQLNEFSKKLNSGNGTLRQLVHNPDLYQKLDRAAGNIEEVSRRLKPIVNDVRVFADKIARDPGRLGVKGALNRNGSGLK